MTTDNQLCYIIYMNCQFNDCENQSVAKGKCWKHYARERRHGDSSITKRPRDGRTKHPLYKTYLGMLDRTQNSNHRSFSSYGGKGVRVCERWQGRTGFLNFVQDMGDKPSPQHSIDRIDTSKDYSPENCRWANNHQQAANTTRSNKHVGVSWSQAHQMWRATIRVDKKNISLGWSHDYDKAVDLRKAAEIKYNIYLI